MEEHITATLTRLTSQVEWWQDQANQVERDRANLRYVVPTGLVLGAAIAIYYLYVGLGVFGISVVIWAMGLYMTGVRRIEFRDNLAEAQANLREVQNRVEAQRTSNSNDRPL
jgi:hypothetical protein